MKSFSPLSKPTTAPFIGTNRLKLAQFAEYIQSKTDIDLVIFKIDRLFFMNHYDFFL